MRVLIIKLTSMGDLMHALPAITDAVSVMPNLEFHWVVDESFQEVPRWHQAVKKTITTAHRRWKKNILNVVNRGELKQFYQLLNKNDYDVVIDMQGNLKSGFVSVLRRGPVHGYDKKSCREWPAHRSYKHRYPVNLKQHSTERQRDLFAQVFNYKKPTTPINYGVDFSNLSLPDVDLPEKYIVFVHNASWPTKLWAILSRADGAVCSDTGLAHMAAVAKTPAITLYAVTDTLLIGTEGENQHHIVAEGGIKNASMADISVEMVFKKLEQILPASDESL